MRWLKNKLRDWILNNEEDDCIVSPKRSRLLSTSGPRSFETRGMGFTVYGAIGGNILEYSSYDEKKDCHEHRLHIITSDQDLGQGIAHIITYEMLRK
jgi:hypothetical protein